MNWIVALFKNGLPMDCFLVAREKLVIIQWIKFGISLLVVVTHTCNPSYLGD
jgi:hypothetical protein